MFRKEPADLIHLDGSVVQDPCNLCCLGTSFLPIIAEGENQKRSGYFGGVSYVGSPVLGMGNVWLTIEWVWCQ